MSDAPRVFVLHESTYPEAQALRPKVAVLPWGATEAHNAHLPHGTDTIEATCLAESAAAAAHQQGARCVVLPTIPFGNNNTQLTQVATITLRSATQQAMLFDVADSLVRQGISRLVLLNFHGGNEFKSMIRDVMLDLPIFIAQVHGFLLAPPTLLRETLQRPQLGHADEFETSLLLHLTPHLVRPLETAGPGATQAPAVASLRTPGVWFPRDWQQLTPDTGDGDPRAATAQKGKVLFDAAVQALTLLLVELSAADASQFPLAIRRWPGARTTS